MSCVPLKVVFCFFGSSSKYLRSSREAKVRVRTGFTLLLIDLKCSCLVCTLMMPVLQVLEANLIVGQNPIACQRTLETYIQAIGAEDDEEAVVLQLIQVEFEVHYVLNILRVGTTGE